MNAQAVPSARVVVKAFQRPHQVEPVPGRRERVDLTGPILPAFDRPRIEDSGANPIPEIRDPQPAAVLLTSPQYDAPEAWQDRVVSFR